VRACWQRRRPGRRRAGGHVLALGALLESKWVRPRARATSCRFVEGDGTRLARAGRRAAPASIVAERVVDLPGVKLQLRVDSSRRATAPDPQPVAWRWCWACRWRCSRLVLLLARDVRRRAAAEERLAEALAFRKAMEDSLVTGLRARDLHGRITYVNPAFCEMVGFGADELLSAAVPAVLAAGPGARVPAAPATAQRPAVRGATAPAARESATRRCSCARAASASRW
jgi:PAS domain-containing protein